MYIFVKVNACKARFDFLPENVIPVKRVLRPFTHQDIHFKRKQFPLTCAYAITDYKAQGETLLKAIIDLRIPPEGKWHIFHAVYVMLSRVCLSAGLYVLTNFSRDDLKNVKPPPYILAEYRRLEALESQS
jgi:hypothetical protein